MARRGTESGLLKMGSKVGFSILVIENRRKYPLFGSGKEEKYSSARNSPSGFMVESNPNIPPIPREH